MTDISELVKRLRRLAPFIVGDMVWEAADALEAQAKEIAKLRAALKPFEKYQTEYPAEYSKHPIIGAFLNELRAAHVALNGENK